MGESDPKKLGRVVTCEGESMYMLCAAGGCLGAVGVWSWHACVAKRRAL